MHNGRCWAPHVGFMENEHGDLWELQLVVARQIERPTRTGSRRTAENKQAVQRWTKHNTLSNGSTLSLGQLTRDAYKRTANEPKTTRAVQQSSSVRILGHRSGTGYMTDTSNGEVSPRKDSVQRQFNQHNTALHTQLEWLICTSTEHSHSSTSTVQHQHTRTAGLIKY